MANALETSGFCANPYLSLSKQNICKCTLFHHLINFIPVTKTNTEQLVLFKVIIRGVFYYNRKTLLTAIIFWCKYSDDEMERKYSISIGKCWY